MQAAATIEKNNQDTEVIVKTLKDMNEMLTSAQIATLTGFKRSRIKALLKDEVEINPNVVSYPRKGYQYVVKPEKKEEKMEPVKKPERYDDTKNNEGYSDPTAFLAMRSVIDDTFKQEPGQVWETDRKPYLKESETNMAVVLMPYKGAVSCLEVKKIDEWYDPDIMCTFSWKGVLYYVDPRRVMQRPIKWFMDSRFRLDDPVFEEIKNKVGAHLDVFRMTDTKIVEVEKPVEVEKIVEKEVPAEITVESAIDFLQECGWMEQHDKALTESAAPSETEELEIAHNALNIIKRQFAEAAAARDAYREALHLVCGDKKLGGIA